MNIDSSVYGSSSVPRGMWHQHGRIPEETEGVFLEVGPPPNYQKLLASAEPRNADGEMSTNGITLGADSGFDVSALKLMPQHYGFTEQ